MLIPRLLLAVTFAAAIASHAETVIEAWNRGYDSPSAGNDYAVGVSVDATGNVAVVGRSAGTGTDIYTLKSAPDGALLWEKRYTSAGSDVPYAIACDAVGNVVITG